MAVQKYTYDLAAGGANAYIPAGRFDGNNFELQLAASQIVTALSTANAYSDRVEIFFKGPLSPGDLTLLDGDATAGTPAGGLLGAHTGDPVASEAVSDLGNQVVAIETAQSDAVRVAVVGTTGKSVIYGTHNFCDPTTWYSASKRASASTAGPETITVVAGSGGAHWQLPWGRLVNIFSGQIFDDVGIVEDQAIFEPDDPHGYSVVVRVDGVVQRQRAQFLDERNEQQDAYDVELDYASGLLKFKADMSGRLIEVDCSHTDPSSYQAGDLAASTFVLRPLPNRSLEIHSGEAQFSADVVYNRALMLETFGFSQYFAPQLGLPANTLIPLEKTIYRSAHHFILEARNADAGSRVLAVSPTTAGRGMTEDIQVFPLVYAPVKKLFAVLGMETRIYLAGYQDAPSHQPFGGEHASATFYMRSQTITDPKIALAKLAEE